MIELGRVMRELFSLCEDIRNVRKILVRNLEGLIIQARVREKGWVI
jgi:hypothetical protein